MIIKNTNGAGLKALIETLKKAPEKEVYVGITKANNSGLGEGEEFNMAGLYAVHEFGSPKRNIPERSTLRATFHDDADLIVTEFGKGVQSYVEKGKPIDDVFYQKLGLYISGRVKLKFTTAKLTPLKPETIKRKGSDVPLIDTGAMRQAIDYEVE